jgi:hypothetical protein
VRRLSLDSATRDLLARAVYNEGVLGDWWVPQSVTGVADGGPAGLVTDLSENGNNWTQTGSNRPIYRKSGWPTDGGPCLEFVSASNHCLRLDALANLFGSYASGAQSFTIAVQVRFTWNSGGCILGAGDSGGSLFGQWGCSNNLPEIVTIGGPRGTYVNIAPGWLHPWVPFDGSTVARDAIIIFAVDQLAKDVTAVADNGGGACRLTMDNSLGIASGMPLTVAGVGGATEVNGSWPSVTLVNETQVDLVGSTYGSAFTSTGYVAGRGYVHLNGHMWPTDTGRDSASTYDRLTLGALIMGSTVYNPASMYLRSAVLRLGLADAAWIASVYYKWGRLDLLSQRVQWRGDSIPAFNLDDTGVAPYPNLVTYSTTQCAGKASLYAPNAIDNYAVPGASNQDVIQPLNPPPDGVSGYVLGEAFQSNLLAQIYSNAGGITPISYGVDGGGYAVNDPWEAPVIFDAMAGAHEDDRQYSPTQTVQRRWAVLQRIHDTYQQASVYILDMAPKVVPGINDATRVAANAIMAKEWRGYADGLIPIGSYAPLQNPSANGYFVAQSGTYIHPNAAGRPVFKAGVQPYVTAFLAQANLDRIDRMLVTRQP